MKIVQVRKYGDLVPVQLREDDWENHLESLAQVHGESAIVLENGNTLAQERQPERDRQEREAAEAAEAERLRIEEEAEAARIAAEEAAAKAETERLAAEEAEKKARSSGGAQ